MGDLQRSDRSKECFSSWFRYGCYHFHFSNCWACVDDDSVHSDREIARAAWTRGGEKRVQNLWNSFVFGSAAANWWVSDWPFAWLWRVCSRSEELSGLDLHSWYFLKTERGNEISLTIFRVTTMMTMVHTAVEMTIFRRLASLSSVLS